MHSFLRYHLPAITYSTIIQLKCKLGKVERRLSWLLRIGYSNQLINGIYDHYFWKNPLYKRPEEKFKINAKIAKYFH